MEDLTRLIASKLVRGVWQLDEGPLRSSATGQAYLFGAHDGRNGERVVVKVFRAERARDVGREVETLRRLTQATQRFTVPFLDHGEHAEVGLCLPYIVMGFAEGIPLDEVLARPLLTADEALAVIVQIAEGLAELHRARVIHGDLKPANIILRALDVDAARPEQYFAVKLVDFGISVALPPGVEQHVTAPMGTPMYMAPEQQTERNVLTFGADLYAFALVARDLLSGQTRRGVISGEVALADLEKALATRARPRALLDIFDTCLQPRPEDRFPDAVALLDRLRPLVPPGPTVSTYPSARALRQWRLRLFSAAGFADLRRPLAGLSEWGQSFARCVVFACLEAHPRERAYERLAAGDDPEVVLEEVRRTVRAEHEAARAAVDLATVRLSARAELLPGDAADVTLLPRTLFETVREVLADPERDDLSGWIRSVSEALGQSALVQQFTLGRVVGRELVVRHANGEQRYPFRTLAGGASTEHDPVLVKINTLGKPDATVPPVRLAPFAQFSGDGVELLFLTGAPNFSYQDAISGAVAPPPRGHRGAATGVVGRRAGPRASSLALPGRPTLALIGPEWCYLLLDSGDWSAVAVDLSAMRQLPRTAGVSAVALAWDGELALATYDRMFARLRGDAWEYTSQDSEILALASHAAGLLVGDASGAVALIDDGTTRQLAHLDAPVTDLGVGGPSGLFALDAAARVWRLPALDEPPVRVELPDELGRPCGLACAVESAGLGVFGPDRVAWITPGETVVLSQRFAEGVRALAVDAAGTLWTFTDAGTLWHVDGRTLAARHVRLPGQGGQICGVRPLNDGGVLCWSSAGALFRVGRDRTIRLLADQGVVLAGPGHRRGSHTGQALVIRWNAGDGATLRWEELR